MTDTISRLHDHEVEPQREVRNLRPVRERPALQEPIGRGADPDTLAGTHRLLGQTKRPIGAPPDLDDHEYRRWPRVNADQVQLMPTDVHVPAEDRPASSGELIRNELLGGIAMLLGVRAHPVTVATTN